MRKLAGFFKALGDETRLKIIRMLSEKEMCVCEIIDQLELSQPAVSHHLKILRQAGLVKDSKEGKWVFYTLEEGALIEYSEEFNKIFAQPIRESLSLGTRPSKIRTDCSVCEKLMAKHEAFEEVK
ncbi:MAG: metalloregulator ArsR/SmtB family transcription factor [Clostridia bacterium]|nr:metalloregulator ArsR/SmtB family transcription factor [Clostridia bacterium]